MRVIAGDLRSRKIKRVENINTRETKDRVKESIFNMIGPYHQMNDVLDLFAGSGSLGIESCSRGAKHIDFVDQSVEAIKVLKDNIKDLDISSFTKVSHMDALMFLAQTNHEYDLIFLDPPYHLGLVEQCLRKIVETKCLKEDGLIIILSDQHTETNETKEFTVLKKKRITRTNVVFLKWRN